MPPSPTPSTLSSSASSSDGDRRSKVADGDLPDQRSPALHSLCMSVQTTPSTSPTRRHHHRLHPTSGVPPTVDPPSSAVRVPADATGPRGCLQHRKHYFGCPDDKTFRYMASMYSRWHYNMSLSNEFEGGITNGALWYPIYGGMQDWNYIHGGCFELTLEISDNKWPKANELPVLWEHNRMSMLNLVRSLVKTGVHGRIYSSDKGQPLPASVTIKGIDYAMNAGKTLGDYHRMLSPGENYEVMVTVPGFRSKSTRIRLEEEAASLDFILDPELDATKGARQSGTNCDCSCDDEDKLGLLGFLRGIHFEVYIVVFLFLCLLLKRKTISKFVNHRRLHGQKRAIVV